MNKLFIVSGVFALTSIGVYYATSTWATIKNTKMNKTKFHLDIERKRRADERTDAQIAAMIRADNARERLYDGEAKYYEKKVEE